MCATCVCVTDPRHRARPGGSTFADYFGSRKLPFPPALAAAGGEGRREGISWVAEIEGSCQTLYHRDKPEWYEIKRFLSNLVAKN